MCSRTSTPRTRSSRPSTPSSCAPAADARPRRRPGPHAVRAGRGRLAAVADRLLHIATELDDWLDRYRPDAVAVEQVFAQRNLHTVMGTSQVMGIAILAAAR